MITQLSLLLENELRPSLFLSLRRLYASWSVGDELRPSLSPTTVRHLVSWRPVSQCTTGMCRSQPGRDLLGKHKTFLMNEQS